MCVAFVTIPSVHHRFSSKSMEKTSRVLRHALSSARVSNDTIMVFHPPFQIITSRSVLPLPCVKCRNKLILWLLGGLHLHRSCASFRNPALLSNNRIRRLHPFVYIQMHTVPFTRSCSINI